MEVVSQKVKKLLSLLGFPGAEISVDAEHRKISIFIDDIVLQDNVSAILPALDHILNLMLRKESDQAFVVDVNHYRKDRERIIIDLAKAAARKAMITKGDVELPPMNAYERRLVHMEITAHPELKTESVGASKERRVVIKHVV